MKIIRILIRVIIAVFSFTPVISVSQTTDLGPVKKHCAVSEEMLLYKYINEYRTLKKLPPIPLSRSLSYVARTHAMDLTINRPDFGGCNPHSWSAKGKWKSCCYAHDNNRIQCMNEKPKELTGYKAKGWEMVYFAGEEAKASDVVYLWKSNDLMNDYLLNTGKWVKPWKAIGIGFYGEYACVWFGEGEDTEKGFCLCNQDSTNRIEPESSKISPQAAPEHKSSIETSVKFFVITGSISNGDKALAEVKRLHKQGYSKAKTLSHNDNFRISADEFETEAEAEAALLNLKKLFPGAWILKPGVEK